MQRIVQNTKKKNNKREEHERMNEKEKLSEGKKILKSKYQQYKEPANNNNGITLIALVITIIVLLILAGVTINLTLGENGIFRTAEMAGKNYTEAQEQELAGIANFNNEINNIIGGLGNNSEVSGPLLKDVAKPVDYVKYDTGTEKGVVLFRVLYNDTTNGLQIISDKNVEEVTLGTKGEDLTAWQASMNDYNNAIATLNQKAERYAKDSPYAIDGRCVGSVPTVGADGEFNAKNSENAGPVELQFATTVEGANNMKDADANYEADYSTMEALEDSGEEGMLTTGEVYWLTSRYVDDAALLCDFFVRNVITNGTLNYVNLCDVGAEDYVAGAEYRCGLRPCISLNQNVKVIGGDGKEATPYELDI